MKTLTDNRPSAASTKIQLRQGVLDAIDGPRVFDAFCGIDGYTHQQVWHRADHYVGVDKEYRWPDPRRRFVADNLDVMAAIDMQDFNVFDFDAYGSPWTQMLALSKTRQWEPGEKGAVVITDGSAGRIRFGGLPAAMAEVLGVDVRQAPPSLSDLPSTFTSTVKAWLEMCGLTAIDSKMAVSKSGDVGSQMMIYAAVVFTG